MDNKKWPYEEEPEDDDLIGTLFWGDPYPEDIKESGVNDTEDDDEDDREWWEHEDPV